MRKNKNLTKALNVACYQSLGRERNSLLNASTNTKNEVLFEELWKKYYLQPPTYNKVADNYAMNF
jgi:hypothetical protein